MIAAIFSYSFCWILLMIWFNIMGPLNILIVINPLKCSGNCFRTSVMRFKVFWKYYRIQQCLYSICRPQKLETIMACYDPSNLITMLLRAYLIVVKGISDPPKDNPVILLPMKLDGNCLVNRTFPLPGSTKTMWTLLLESNKINR